MKLMPTCREVQILATEYREGSLPFSQRLGIAVHLALCWACRAFLRGLDALPGIGKRLLKPVADAPPQALDALAAALKEIRR